MFPIAIPNVIARRQKNTVPAPVYTSAIARSKPKEADSDSNGESMDIDVPAEDDFDPVRPNHVESIKYSFCVNRSILKYPLLLPL